MCLKVPEKYEDDIPLLFRNYVVFIVKVAHYNVNK
jgi:hypothetical protein